MTTTPHAGSTTDRCWLGNAEPGLARGWHPVATSAEVGAAPVPVLLLGTTWWLLRGQEGLSASLAPPGRRRPVDSPPAGLAESAGLVWLAPEDPVAALLACPEWDDAGFARGMLHVAGSRAAAGLLADNFLDAAHFPFVHASTFGSADDVLVEPYEVLDVPGGFTVTEEHPYRNTDDPGVARGERPLLQRRRMTYRYALPFQLQLRLQHLWSGGTTVIVFALQPETEGRTVVRSVLLQDDLGGEPPDLARLLASEARIVAEDLALQARYDVPGLPLEPRLEVSVRCDAAGLAMRRLLRGMLGTGS